MKYRRLARVASLILLIVSLSAVCSAESQQNAPLYEARLVRETTMRVRPERGASRVCGVPTDAVVYIYQWAEDWCYCAYGTLIGYLPTERLFELSALTDVPVPGYIPCHGLAVMTQDLQLKMENGFTTSVSVGDVLCVVDGNGLVPMMRGTCQLPEGSFLYAPIADVAQAGSGQIVAAYTTWYNKKTGGALAANRRFNISLGASLLNGTVLNPNGRFSFNHICGPYDSARGYKKAPNISVDGFGTGGGVCQVSTTLYEAILPLSLEIESWQVHRASGVPYAPVNLDCAVGNSRDFVFTNTLPVPLRIDVRVQQGSLTVMLLVDSAT